MARPEDMEKIKAWRLLAGSQEDVFIQFALEYFAFNAILKTYFEPNNYVQDRTLIEKLKKDIKCYKDISDKKSSSILELKEVLDKEPLINNTRNGNKDIKIKSGKEWDCIVEAVYVIRNNLFHGEKWSQKSRDKNLVEIGYQILLGFNDYLIKNISIS